MHVGPIVRWTLPGVVFGNLTRTQHLARAKARLFMKGFTEPDLLETESHSPTLAREDFMTVVQGVSSHGHRLQFGDVQQAFNTGDPIKRGSHTGVAVDSIAGGRDEVREQAVAKLKQRFTFGHWEVGKVTF